MEIMERDPLQIYDTPIDIKYERLNNYCILTLIVRIQHLFDVHTILRYRLLVLIISEFIILLLLEYFLDTFLFSLLIV